MKRDVYEALKTRLTVKFVRIGVATIEFDNEGLNVGISCFDDGYIDQVVVQFGFVRFNLWNAAQRVHSVLRRLAPGSDSRLVANPKR